MANNVQNQNDTGLYHLNPTAANRSGINYGQAGSQLSHINNSHELLVPANGNLQPLHLYAMTPGLSGQYQQQHHSSAGLGLQQPDVVDLHKIATMIQSQQQRLDGLDKLATALAKTPARKLLCEPQSSIPGANDLQNIFKGLRSCLQVPETQSDALLRVNQILYDMMQDLPRSPNDLMPEVTALIPFFIENLGNSKATVRKSTHKCIGTYVKFSKRLEFVITNIIKYGLENQNQRTRQHSMLVIPALISLKVQVIQGSNLEMKQLIEAVIGRLRDPTESVAKTAKKLLLELQKCYPTDFKSNYIDTLQSEDDRAICSLILDNKFEEATKLIMSTSPSKRMAQQQNNSYQVHPQTVFNPPPSETSSAINQSQTGTTTRTEIQGGFFQQQSPNFGAIGKTIVPQTSIDQPPLFQSPSAEQNPKSVIQTQNSFTNSQIENQSSNSFIASDRQARAFTEQNSFNGGSILQQTSSVYKQNIQTQPSLNNTKLNELSVVGREIMNSQSKGKTVNAPAPLLVVSPLETQGLKSSESLKTKVARSQTQGGLPIDATNGLVFGFLEERLVDGLNENNQWKDRTNAMEQIEAQLMQLIGNPVAKQKLTEQTATAFLGFIYQFITDINFKISLATIKIVTLLLQEDMINLKLYFTSLLGNLVEKLSDSKQVVRDMVMECCCSLITRSKPANFATQIIKFFQHANWHVREGVLILLVRSILVTSVYEARKLGSALKPNIPGNDSSSLSQICTNAQLIEEICFLVKVEDKKQLQQMGIDTLALLIAKSPFKLKTEGLVMKELSVTSDSSNLSQTKDNQIYEQIQQRIQAQAFPFINSQDQVEFAPATTTQTQLQPASNQPPSALFLQHKQNEQVSAEGVAPQPASEIQQISQSLQQMQINSNFTAKAGGPSSKMQMNQPGLLNQITPGANSYKTPSMAFLESKRREEEKQLQSQQYPQSADQKKVTAPLSPINASQAPTGNSSLASVNVGGLQQNQQSSYSMRKLQKQGKESAQNNGNLEDENGNKIAMWLPSFSPMPEPSSSQLPSTSIGARKQDMTHSPIITSSKDLRTQLNEDFSNQSNQLQISPQGNLRSLKAQEYNGYHLNATASSSATFIEESRTNYAGVQTGQLNNGNLSNNRGQALNSRQPIFSEANKTQSDMQQNNFSSGQKLNIEQRSGYIPEVGKPRSIQSNYDKQRTFNQAQVSSNSSNQSSTGPSLQTISGTTQPTTNSNGFDKSQISDRLQLLKNTSKYKTKAGEGQKNLGQTDAMSGNVGSQMHADQDSDGGMNGGGLTQNMNYTVMPETDDQLSSHTNSMYNQRHGPIRAAHLTINQDQNQQQNVGSKKMSAGLPTHVQLKQRASQPLQTMPMSSQSSQKPPTISQYSNFTGINEPRGASATQYDETSRASSIDYQANMSGPLQLHQMKTNSNERPIRPAQNRQNLTVAGSQSEKKQSNARIEPPQTLSNLLKQDSEQVYETKEEPLANPEAQLRPAIESLKSSDWSKTFEGCNIIKRGVMFHKNLFVHPSALSTQIFKDIVKAVDSLRSQVAKNACLTLSTMFSELPPRDVDNHIETVMPIVIKRATDTNQFISSEADKTLIAICNNCTETRVFAALQAQAMKNNQYKEKICMAYTVLIERLAHRLKTFRDIERLVQTVVRFLSEGAVEVRNQAKYAVLTLQSISGSQRELDSILLKARLNENQMDKVKKVLASEDFESLSNYANTRYGASMRASPLGGARHTQYNAVGVAQPKGHKANSSYGASGSDGFQRNNLNNMQQTFLSSGADQINNVVIRGGSSGPVGMSGIGNQIGSGGVLSEPHVTKQKGSASNQGSSSGFDATQNTFNRRTTSVSKPVDRNLIEELKNLVDGCNTTDWQKRVKAIDLLEAFARNKSTSIKNAHASFINLMDAYCKLLMDNNTKVQTKCQQSFEAILGMSDMGALVNANLSMIVAALTSNMCSTNPTIRQQSDRLFDFLEEIVVTESRGNTNALLQPIVGALSQQQNKVAKPHLVDRLCNLVERVDKVAIITRLLNPLLQPGHKLQQEANGNVALKQALDRLGVTIQSAELGIPGMGIGLKSQY